MNDYTAICVVQAVSVAVPGSEVVREPAILAGLRHGRDAAPRTLTQQRRVTEHRVRHVERLRGRAYPEVVDRITAVTNQVYEQAADEVRRTWTGDRLLYRTPDPDAPLLMLDGTGVGRAVLDLIRLANLPAWTHGVTITGGDSVSRDGADWRVPKRDLVSAVQVLLGQGRVKWPARLPLRETLEKELTSFRVKVTPAANESFGAWREGEHDDLVLALALACWGLEWMPGAPAAA